MTATKMAPAAARPPEAYVTTSRTVITQQTAEIRDEAGEEGEDRQGERGGDAQHRQEDEGGHGVDGRLRRGPTEPDPDSPQCLVAARHDHFTPAIARRLECPGPRLVAVLEEEEGQDAPEDRHGDGGRQPGRDAHELAADPRLRVRSSLTKGVAQLTALAARARVRLESGQPRLDRLDDPGNERHDGDREEDHDQADHEDRQEGHGASRLRPRPAPSAQPRRDRREQDGDDQCEHDRGDHRSKDHREIGEDDDQCEHDQDAPADRGRVAQPGRDERRTSLRVSASIGWVVVPPISGRRP